MRDIKSLTDSELLELRGAACAKRNNADIKIIDDELWHRYSIRLNNDKVMVGTPTPGSGYSLYRNEHSGPRKSRKKKLKKAAWNVKPFDWTR